MSNFHDQNELSIVTLKTVLERCARVIFGAVVDRFADLRGGKNCLTNGTPRRTEAMRLSKPSFPGLCRAALTRPVPCRV